MRTLIQLLGLCTSCVFALKPLASFSFSDADPPVDVTGTVNKECDGAAKFKEDAPGIVLALDENLAHKRCHSDGRYNDKDFTIESGRVGTFRAYQISGPKTKASEWRASKNTIWLSFDKIGSYKVYLLTANGALQEAGMVKSSTAGDFVKTSLLADAPKTLVVAPAETRASGWQSLGEGVEGAIVWQVPSFRVTARRWDVSVGQPYDPSKSFQTGPASWAYRYGARKYFFPVFNADKEGVVWQDPSTKKIFLTWLTKDFTSVSHVELPTGGMAKPFLEAAAGNGKGEVAYVIVAAGCGKCDKVTPTSCSGFKVDSAGKQLATKKYDTSPKGLNIYQSFTSGASMAWNSADNTLGLVISRTMTRGGDGLNHQGAIAVVLDGKDMSILQNYGQTSGHSFGSSVHVGKDGKFVGADMGDNYPRGIHLFSFATDARKQSKVVYTFKTKHCTAKEGMCYGKKRDKYTEISTSKVTFYKQSNDNEVYTELAHRAAVPVDDDALLVLFSGEKPSLDNGMAVKSHNAPRNIGFVKVPRDMKDKSVLSAGPTETGGFYNFGGGWSKQENKGVNWITDFKSMEENASRLKATKLSDGQVLVLFETWTGTKYVSSNVMTVDQNGKVTRGSRASKYPFRMPFSDEILSTGSNTAVFYAGAEGKLVRYEVSLDPPGVVASDAGAIPSLFAVVMMICSFVFF